MNNKLNNLLNEFFKETEDLSDEETEIKLQEFIKKYNNRELEYEETLMDKAFELMEKAYNESNEKKAIKYAKDALKICPECVDAELFIISNENSSIKQGELIDKVLEKEKNRLIKENIYTDDNIGDFYGIFETRPYMRALAYKASYLTDNGKYTLAISILKEILELNTNDNLGMRYMLMAIYSYLEREEDTLELYNKYKEDSFSMLFPLLVLYYRLGNEKKAKEYLKKVNKVNNNLVKLFKGEDLVNDETPSGYYSHGNLSEIYMYIEGFDFLMDSVPNIDEFVIKNSK